MKIVIDIPDEEYERIQAMDWRNGHRWYSYETIAIHNGTPLPKHGRLIDEKEAIGLIAEGKNGDKAYFGTVNKDWEVIDFFKTLSTIIEADKEE